MSVRFWFAPFVLTLGLALPLAKSPATQPTATTPATPSPEPGAGQDQTTIDDQVDLAVTVYNSDIALVRDVRNLRLPRGISDLHFMDIAATVNPATVHFRSLTEPSRVSVLEQNYEYDLLEPEKLLRKYVGRDVTLVRTRQQDGTTQAEEVKARLLSYNNAPVWQIGNEIVTGMHADHIRFPELPDNLYARPTLIWTLENSGGATPPRRGVVSGGQALVERRLRADRRARRQGGRPRRLGDADQRQRHVVPQRQAAARRRRSQPRPPGDRAHGRWTRCVQRPRRGADGAGGVLRLPPLHARPEDDDQQQRDQAGQHARRHRRPGPEALRRRRAGVLLPQRAASRARRSRTSCRCTTSSRTRSGPASACRCRPASCASIRPTRRAACSSSARIASTTRRRTRR